MDQSDSRRYIGRERESAGVVRYENSNSYSNSYGESERDGDGGGDRERDGDEERDRIQVAMRAQQYNSTYSTATISHQSQHRMLGEDSRDILSLFIGSVKTAQASSRALRTALYNQVRHSVCFIYSVHLHVGLGMLITVVLCSINKYVILYVTPLCVLLNVLLMKMGES